MEIKQQIYSGLIIILIALTSCMRKETAPELLLMTINAIDAIETISYKQDMARTNPRNTSDTIFRYREMFFKRLITDSIVGVKGHWYMYINDKENVIFEDIYDGSRLIRKNNRESTARVYDLIKYPDFKRQHFWGHNTIYGMQHEFKYILDHTDSYALERLNDTIVDDKDCYQIRILLEDMVTMPGFAIALENNKGSISKTYYYIDKETNYPIRMKGESLSKDHPEQKVFIDQRYYDIKFNQIMDEQTQFNTSNESIADFEIKEMKPE